MHITEAILKKIAPAAPKDAAKFVEPFNTTLDRYNINTLLRAASFFGQTMHESGSLHYVKEIASGRAYEGRKDLGNIHPGDGVKYKGRGIIQITGRSNYEKLSKDFGVDFINSPELLEQPEYAVLAAGWFWDKHNLNALADQNKFIRITEIINGGRNGLASRQQHLSVAMKALQPLFT